MGVLCSRSTSASELGEPRIVPRVLGHLTEVGRVMGILLERLDGEFASADDLPACSSTIRRLHEIGLVHGNVNRYNFIVDKQSRQVISSMRRRWMRQRRAWKFSLWCQSYKKT